MRRFEKRDKNGSEIYWQIERDGTIVDRSWGLIGGVSQYTTDTYASEAEASAVFEQRARTALSRGYVETSPRRMERLQRAIDLDDLAPMVLAAPDDPDVYQVLADSLQDQGDPRGQLASLQLEMEAIQRLQLTPDDTSMLDRLGKLSRREHKVMTEHRRFLLGPLVRLVAEPGVHHRAGVAVRKIRLTWRWGWIHTIRHPYRSLDLEDLVRRIQRAPAARFLRELHLSGSLDHPALEDLPETCVVVSPEPDSSA